MVAKNGSVGLAAPDLDDYEGGFYGGGAPLFDPNEQENTFVTVARDCNSSSTGSKPSVNVTSDYPTDDETDDDEYESEDDDEQDVEDKNINSVKVEPIDPKAPQVCSVPYSFPFHVSLAKKINHPPVTSQVDC